MECLLLICSCRQAYSREVHETLKMFLHVGILTWSSWVAQNVPTVPLRSHCARTNNPLGSKCTAPVCKVHHYYSFHCPSSSHSCTHPVMTSTDDTKIPDGMQNHWLNNPEGLLFAQWMRRWSTQSHLQNSRYLNGTSAVAPGTTDGTLPSVTPPPPAGRPGTRSHMGYRTH